MRTRRLAMCLEYAHLEYAHLLGICTLAWDVHTCLGCAHAALFNLDTPPSALPLCTAGPSARRTCMHAPERGPEPACQTPGPYAGHMHAPGCAPGPTHLHARAWMRSRTDAPACTRLGDCAWTAALPGLRHPMRECCHRARRTEPAHRRATRLSCISTTWTRRACSHHREA